MADWTGVARRADHPASLTPDAAAAPLDPRQLLTSLGEVVYDWDLRSDRLSFGSNGAEVIGLDCRGALATGAAFDRLIDVASGPGRCAFFRTAAGEDTGAGVPFRLAYRLRIGATDVAVEDSGRWYAGPDGHPAIVHGVMRIAREPALAGVARTDGWADLARTIDTLFAGGCGRHRPLTLIFLAIDNLGAINAALGYARGDDIIAATAQVLTRQLRQGDLLIRHGSNRFALVMRGCSAQQATVAAARMAGLAAAAGGAVATVRLRMGAATAPQHADDAETLMRNANLAFDEARRLSGSGFVFYGPQLAATMTARRAAAEGIDILAALNERRIVPARQAIVDAETRQPAFHEALLRVRMPDGAAAGAARLVPAAEKAGLIEAVDHRMLELITARMTDEPGLRVALNISPRTLASRAWLGNLAAQLGACPGVAERLIIEITETAAVEDPGATRASLDAMKALGVFIAIDDFGAGHTSFRHLRHFPIDLLKIDGAFVQNLARSSDDRFFVRTLVDLAQHLGIATVAEWVEDEDTARLLTQWGVDYLQGEHIAPVTAWPEPAGLTVERARERARSA
ncbi:diguanylate cyclase (GGDEF) domain [Chelatococcus sambhunathii]|uniref:Diguanylate cyclase (GGDEF) domain n=1 Tax=Chelatococcus sambhunathii TaxID=363953 RepID=A0ABP2A4K2_9HYPH|nr:bifunctional diguanylate cyclase/phosphodiesterase [Chelatococcus sambhunathii]CUA88868.1 diguanylate cyclase (GGDEF) domain [Chelatococcus sambhunathii]